MIFYEKTIETERIYEGKILNLRRDKVTVLTGESYREIVEHSGGAVIAAITEDNNIIIVKQFRKPFNQAIIEVPAGKRDGNENGEEVARRELKEETGYSAGNIVHLTTMYTSPGYSEEVLDIFLARDLTPGETDFDENEAIEIFEMPLYDAVDMVMRGEIPDGKTQLAILMTNEYLKRERSI